MTAEIGCNYTTVYVGADGPPPDVVVATVYVDGEVWQSKRWRTFGNSVFNVYFFGRPPPGELWMSIRPITADPTTTVHQETTTCER
jgi:hypothetical protein